MEKTTHKKQDKSLSLNEELVEYKLNDSFDTIDEFLFTLDGLIDGKYFVIKTDSKIVLKKIIELMDGK